MIAGMKRGLNILLAVWLAAALAACGSTANKEEQENGSGNASTKQAELIISAAASLTDAMNDIKAMYEAKEEGVVLRFNFGGSGALQEQIEQGAPADLFFSAAAKNMKALVEKGLIEESAQQNLLSNELVAVVPKQSGAALRELADLEKNEIKRIAIGIPESVPAGNYAKEAFEKAGLWEQMQGKSVQAKDVRQVLQYVETGNADVGFVYRTDALTSDKSEIAFTVDSGLYTSVNYPVGIVKATKNGEQANKFYTYLQSEEALAVFERYGFTIVK